MSIPMRYETSYQWQGDGQNGALSAADRDPINPGGAEDESRWSPEHLLLAAVESCLANSFIVIAGFSKVDIVGYSSISEGHLVKEPKVGYRFQRITVRPVVTVNAESRDRAERVMDKVHKVCIISRSLNCTVDVEAEFVQAR
jgi:organic hydroperoxide reductase OsmC/OhrA